MGVILRSFELTVTDRLNESSAEFVHISSNCGFF